MGVASEAARELRKKPCTCHKGVTHFGPHTAECPRFIDRSRAKEIREALIAKRHPEVEGEWLSLVEFNRIDLFAFRMWGESPDEKLTTRSGLPRHRSFHRRVAYEIKVSRSDFRSEMRKPEKRADAVAITHQFFFACPTGLIRKDEVPPECGLVYVDPGGAVKVIRHAPIRQPTKNLTMRDMVSLLNAKHLGPKLRDYREQGRIAAARLREAEREHRRASELLARARIRLMRERGHLLEAGSEWIGPAVSYGRESLPATDDRVVLTSVSVVDGYDQLEWCNGSPCYGVGNVYFKKLADVERDGNMYGGAWMDAGDFLIAFRYAKEPEKVVPPVHSSVHSRKREPLKVIDGGGLTDPF